MSSAASECGRCGSHGLHARALDAAGPVDADALAADRRAARVAFLDRVATNAAMCHLCPLGRCAPEMGRDRPSDSWSRLTTTHTVVACTIGGAVPSAFHEGACPIGRHQDAGGRVRSRGLLWEGVPFPDRLALWVFDVDHRRPWDLPGCGCVARLKAWWRRCRAVASRCVVNARRVLRAGRV